MIIFRNGERIALNLNLQRPAGIANWTVELLKGAIVNGTNTFEVEMVSLPKGQTECCFGPDKLVFYKD